MTSFSLMFDILGYYVLLKTNSNEIFEKISKDFSYFKIGGTFPKSALTIEAFLENPDYSVLEGKKIWRKSRNSITYDDGDIRYNDYWGELLSIYDYSKGMGRIWSRNIDRLHEVAYLLILSLTGKRLDILGLHRVHAMAAVYKGVCFVGMMDMGIGKSTLLSHLLIDGEVRLVSDDMPIVDQRGRFHAFPLRLGVGNIPKDLSIRDGEKNIYTIERRFYGKKQLVCLDGIDNQVCADYGRLVLFEGRRAVGDGVFMEKRSPLHLLCALFRHMVIGMGTPVIFEYFWRSGWEDFWIKTKIAFLRLKAALILASENEFYEVFLGADHRKNADFLKDLGGRG